MADEYTSPPITSCPPVTHLQSYGICCPFIISEEESDARVCISNLQSYPIIWYRQMSIGEAAGGLTNDAIKGAQNVGIDRSASQNAVKGASNFIDGMLGRVDKILGTSARSSVDQASVPLTYIGVKAELSVVDTEEHGPVILVQQILDDVDSSCENDADSKQTPHQAQPNKHGTVADTQKKMPSKLIPLCKIASISHGYSILNDPTAGGIKIYGRSTSILSSGEELLRFDTLGGKGGNIIDRIKETLFPVRTKPNEHVDAVIEQLTCLIEWNRRRIAHDVKKGRVDVAESKNGLVCES